MEKNKALAQYLRKGLMDTYEGRDPDPDFLFWLGRVNEYAQSESAGESTAFLMELANLNLMATGTASRAEVQARVVFFVSNYINSGAPSEINISAGIRDTLVRTYNGGSTDFPSFLKALNASTGSAATEITQMLMSDTLGRYVTSTRYKIDSSAKSLPELRDTPDLEVDTPDLAEHESSENMPESDPIEDIFFGNKYSVADIYKGIESGASHKKPNEGNVDGVLGISSPSPYPEPSADIEGEEEAESEEEGVEEEGENFEAEPTL